MSANETEGPDGLDRPSMTPRARRPIPIWSSRRFQAVAASLGFVAIGGLLAWAVVLQTQVDELQDEKVMLSEMIDSAAEDFDDSIVTALFSLAGENSSSLQFVSNDTGGATARLIWDPDQEIFVLAAMGLDPMEEGSAYIVWLETSEGAVKLPHFYVGESGATLIDGSTTVYLADVTDMTITHESDAEANAP